MNDTNIVRGLIAAVEAQLGPIVDVHTRSRPWASATFAGARHGLSFDAGANADLAQFEGAIGEADIPLRCAFVADVAIVSITPRTGGGHRVAIEFLVIDEG